MTGYWYNISRSAARLYVRKLQVVRSIATNAPWYISNKKIHEGLEVPLIGDHIRALRVLKQSYVVREVPSFVTALT
jgi:hypothetical protein